MTTVYTRRGEAGPGGPAQTWRSAPLNLLHCHGNCLTAGSSDLHYDRNVARRRTAGERHVDLDDARNQAGRGSGVKHRRRLAADGSSHAQRQLAKGWWHRVERAIGGRRVGEPATSAEQHDCRSLRGRIGRAIDAIVLVQDGPLTLAGAIRREKARFRGHQPAFLVKFPAFALAHQRLAARHCGMIVARSDFTDARIAKGERPAPCACAVSFHAPRILRGNPRRAPAEFFGEFRFWLKKKTFNPLPPQIRPVKQARGFSLQSPPSV